MFDKSKIGTGTLWSISIVNQLFKQRRLGAASIETCSASAFNDIQLKS